MLHRGTRQWTQHGGVGTGTERIRMRRSAGRLALIAVAGVVGSAGLVALTPAAALTYPANPVIALNRTIPGSPFPNSSVSARDNEGSAYVPSDDSLWIVDDNGKSAYELDRSSGDLKRRVGSSEFLNTRQFGGGPFAESNRFSDLESAAYDEGNDVLYFFSGNCCLAAPALNEPGVFRLTRDGGGDFQLESFQPLPETADATASAFRPDGVLWTGRKGVIQTYNYEGNTFGPEQSVSGLGGNLYGMTFSDQDTMWVTSKANKVFRVSMSTRAVVPGWSFDLTPYGIKDPRSVEVVGQQLFVGDGYDFRSSADPLRYATFVFDLTELQRPTAGFTPSVTYGRGPLTVGFLDESTGSIASHTWDFGDGTTSTEASPFHTFTTANTFTITLTVRNAAGTATASHTVKVVPSTYRAGGYVLDGFGGIHGFRIGTGLDPAPTSRAPYWPGWDIARGLALAPNGNGGYVLDGFGGIHRFRVGTTRRAVAATGGPYWLGWDIARGIAVLPNGTGGYIVDGFGGIHPFAIGANPLPPATHGTPYWVGQDLAQGLTILPDGTGGYVVDRTGALHPFAIGNGSMPAAPTHVFVSNTQTTRGASVLSDGTGGVTVTGTGVLRRFMVTELPPGTSGATIWPGWDIARDVAVVPE